MITHTEVTSKIYHVSEIMKDIMWMLTHTETTPEKALYDWQIEQDYKIPAYQYDLIIQCIEWS
jgi:hypothetical protein